MLGTDNLVITHATSTYPCEPDELNLHMIETLRDEFPLPDWLLRPRGGPDPLGRWRWRWAPAWWSAISPSTGPCGAADQAASVEPGGFERLVKYIRVTEQSLGDGVKQVYDSELSSLRKLRRVQEDHDLTRSPGLLAKPAGPGSTSATTGASGVWRSR